VKLVGDTASGQPVFAIGPVRLTLPPGAKYFYPVGDCARCGEAVEFPDAVLSEADLELSGQPHVCQTCARTGINAPGPARPSDGPAHAPDVGREVPDASPVSAPGGDATSSTAPGDLDAAWASQAVAIDPPRQSVSASPARQFVPAVRDGEGTDVDPLLRTEVDPSFGGVRQTGQPAEVNGTGDGFDRAGEYVALVLRSATMRAEEIRADAERAAAGLLENAERQGDEKPVGATLIAEVADRDRDEVTALASQLEGTFAGEQQELTVRHAEAGAQAAAIREAAEADAATIREAAEADAARIREVAAAEHAEASTLLAKANAMADQQRRAAEATLEANRQAAAVLAAAEADAARLLEGAEAAKSAAEQELNAAIALGIDARSSQAANP